MTTQRPQGLRISWYEFSGFPYCPPGRELQKRLQPRTKTAAESNHNKSGNVCSPSPKVLEKAAYQDRRLFDQSSTNGKIGPIIISAVSGGLKDAPIFHLLSVGQSYSAQICLLGWRCRAKWGAKF